MRYKLVALDLDGTLFNSESTITQYTSRVLRALDQKGIKIVIATGRSYSSLKPKIKELKLEHPVVCYNGAMIRNGKNDEILYNSTLPEDIARGLIEIARKENMHLQGFIDGEFHYEQESKHSRFYSQLSGLQGKKVDFDSLINIGFTKAMFISEPENLSRIEGSVRELYSNRAFIEYSKPTFLELMNITAS
jgi:Cof subfamily protein (haloacid dehalogenase superfamily)